MIIEIIWDGDFGGSDGSKNNINNNCRIVYMSWDYVGKSGGGIIIA